MDDLILFVDYVRHHLGSREIKLHCLSSVGYEAGGLASRFPLTRCTPCNIFRRALWRSTHCASGCDAVRPGWCSEAEYAINDRSRELHLVSLRKWRPVCAVRAGYIRSDSMLVPGLHSWAQENYNMPYIHIKRVLNSASRTFRGTS